MASSGWAYKSAGEIAEALAARKISASELVTEIIARIERHDGAINAICVRDFSRAQEAAREADAALARGERRPLLGVPMTVKESFNVAGTPTTWGFPPYKDFIPAEDALAIARVKAAGAVIVGKTNVPLGLGDWQSYNDIYGTTNNPFDPGRTPGGSSGGSSAALAAGFGALSLGSDIGGSLRVPAHYCGIHAHKPSFALAPARGHTPPPLPPLPSNRDLSVIGPMARSAADLARLLDVIAGPDELDAGVGYRLALPPSRHASLRGFRVLVLDTHPLLPTAAEVRAAIGELAQNLARCGATVSHHNGALPDLAGSSRLYMRLLMSFLAATFPPETYADLQAKAARLKADDDSLQAHRLRGATMSHRDWVIADGERSRLQAWWREVFKTVDAVICPVMPTPAFPHDHSNDQEMRQILIDAQPFPYVDQLVWPGIATTPGLPATAIPVTLSSDGLPIGVQIVGPWLGDRTTLTLAELIEREFGGFKPPPPPPTFADEA